MSLLFKTVLGSERAQTSVSPTWCASSTTGSVRIPVAESARISSKLAVVIVESHCHIISPDQQKYPRDLGPNPGSWVRDLAAEEFIALNDAAGVERAILVQAFGAYRYDNRYVADVVADYPRRFVGVCIVDALRPDAPQTLDFLGQGAWHQGSASRHLDGTGADAGRSAT